MSEEEKNSIEYLKSRLYGNEGCEFIDVAQSDLRTLLNLIEKQQKEIEELHNKIDELENADLTLVYMNGIYDGENKWKDKIKERIKHIPTNEKNNEIRQYQCIAMRCILQELLEEE